MGATPQQKGITIEFDCQFRVCVVQSSFSSITKAFLMLLPQLLEDFFQKVLVGFGEYEMTQERKSFACQCCGNDREFIWKTRHGKATTILTWFRYITLKQLQARCKACGSKQYITRTLLGMEPRKRIPEETRRKLALMGALTSYRVSEKFGKMFGWAIDKMTIWRSVQRVGAGIDFVLDENEVPRCEADGTGVEITGIAKRGKELKVLVQYKKGDGIRVAGIDIGNYNGSWDKLFQKSIEVIKKFKEPFLTNWGDMNLTVCPNSPNFLAQWCELPQASKPIKQGSRLANEQSGHHLLEIIGIIPAIALAAHTSNETAVF